jgi:hypothetical protein
MDSLAGPGLAVGLLRPGVPAHQDGQDVADGGLAAHRIGQREVRLDLIAVAATARQCHYTRRTRNLNLFL